NLVSNQEENANHITLYWHALAPITTDYTISVRGQSADGTLIVQHDQWPVDGLLPTSQWRQGDYITDHHTLTLPPDAPPIDQYEIVVYDAGTNQTLGPPITIPDRP
ncbi:MAG: hypothetical protein KDJ52_35910, partial [Anaerolineae bacterium]|nr:hypothetical protein [Anaerolineae bacterium]